MAYTYDPSQNIKQEFQQAQAGIGDIFTHIIAQQQRDYSLAENTLNNVEALKKNIGIWGTKEITDGANNLLGQVSSAINKNGKLDYSKLGQVRQEISNLADLKTGYDVFGKQFDRLVQVGAANKENLTSFESFYKNLVGLAADKKLIANPNDLATAMNNVLEDHINTSKMGITAIKNNLSVNPITGMYVDPKTKMEVKYSANVFDGVTVGADGKLIKPTDPAYYQALAAKIKASDPAAFDAQRRKLSKIGQSDIPDADIVKSWFDSMPAGEMKPVSMKGEREVQSENIQVKTGELQVEKLAFDVENQDELFRSEMDSKRLRDRLTQAQINKLNSKAGARIMSGVGNVFDASFPAAKKGEKMVGDIKARATDLGGLIPMIVPTSQGNKNLNVKQVFYDENGNARVSYIEEIKAGTGNALYPNLTLPDGQSVNKASKSEKLSYALIPKAKVSEFISILESNLRSKYKDDKDYAIIWNNVRSTFAPVKSSKYSSGQYDEAGNLYLDRSFEPNAAQILKDSEAKSIIYIN